MNASGLKFLLLFAASLALLSGFANASGCGTLPSGINSLITSCIPANILNLQSSATPSGFQQQLSNLPINALAGNFVVYNSLSGSLVPTWVESNSMAWVNFGTNTIGATSNAIDVYYIGLGSPTTQFMLPGTANDIGEAPQLESTSACASYGSCDNGASVFPTLYQNFAGTSQPAGWVSSGTSVTFNNGVTISGGPAGSLEYYNSLINPAGNILEAFLLSSTSGGSNIYAGITVYWATATPAAGGSGTTFYTQSAGTMDGDYGGASLAHTTGASTGSASTQTSGSSTVGADTLFGNSWQTSSSNVGYLNYGDAITNTADIPTIASSYPTLGNEADSSTYETYSYVRVRAYPPAGVMPTVQYGSPQSSTPVSLSITPNPATYGTQVLVTFTPSSSSDGSNIIFQGSTVLTGTGTITYNALGTPISISNALVPGTYTVNGCDTTRDICAGNTILTVNKATPTNTLTSCSSSTLPFTCTTTATISTLGNQEQISLYLGSNLIGSNVLSVSDTESNTIYDYAYTASSPGNGNYLPTSLTASYYGYIPLVFQNITGSALTTRSMAPPQNTVFQTYYPVLFTTSAYNGVTYDLTQSLDYGANVAITTGASSLSYVPPANQATGNVLLVATEHQYGNSITIGANVNLLNMTDISSTPIYTSLYQLYPILANTITFSASPTSYSINSIPASFTITGNTINGAVFQTNVAGSMLPQFSLTYAQFSPPLSFYANAINNPKVTAITISPFVFGFANTINPLMRNVANFSVFSQQSFIGISANVVLQINGTFNNYPFTSNNVVSAATGNFYTLQILKSTYQNPNITLDINNDSATALSGTWYAHYDNFCPVTVANGTAAYFPIGLVNANGSRYDTYVYTNGGGSAAGYRLQILEQKGVGSTAVQEVLIPASLPLVLAMEATGQNYAFVVYSNNCKNIYYKGAFTQPSNPLYITLNVTPAAYVYNITKAAGSCKIVATTNTVYDVSCFASDPTSLAYAYNLKVFNETSAAGTYTIAHQANFTGSAFATNFTLPVNETYSYQIWASIYKKIDPVVQVGGGPLHISQIAIASPLLGMVAFIILLVFAYGGAQTGKAVIALGLVDIGFIFVGLLINIPIYVGAIFIVVSVVVGWIAR